jgi:nucleoside-diphosphate kinase
LVDFDVEASNVFQSSILFPSRHRGLKLLAAKLMRADEGLLRAHYADLSGKGFFPELIRYMGSGPVLPMVWQGLNVVKQGRAMLGATNPKGIYYYSAEW